MQAFTALAANAAENLSPGQAPGSGSAGNTPPSPSASGGSGSGSGTSGTEGATGTASSGPAQATANVAHGFSSQSFFSLGAAAVAAFAML